MSKLNTFDWLTLILVLVGAINWGLVGFFNFDLVATLFGGNMSVLSRIIYGLVGLSAIYILMIMSQLRKE